MNSMHDMEAVSVSRAVNPSGHGDLRRVIDQVAEQVCASIEQSFVREVSLEHKCDSIQNLVGSINFVISSARQAWESSREREARLLAVLETISDGVMVIDKEGVVESVNSKAASMFGYGIHEVKGASISQFVPVPRIAGGKPFNSFKKLESGGCESSLVIQHHVEGICKNGEPLPIEMALSKVWLDGRRLFTAVLRDLTQQEFMRCELAQAQKLEAVGQLAAGIAHEINTPTQYVGDNTRFLQEAFGDLRTALAAYDKLLQAAKQGIIPDELVSEVETTIEGLDTEYLAEEVPRAIEQSLDGVSRVSRIVRAMREFSHPGSQEKSFINLQDAIETTLTVARNEWKYVADVATDFDPDLPDVPCLPGELNQVILNLVVNAAHAITATLGEGATEKGTITVGTRHERNQVAVFYVQDSGTGIAEDIRAKIFDPFFTTKEVGKGTGQGLAIARSVVVDKHGGKIDCESEVGRGTTFTVRLPLEMEHDT